MKINNCLALHCFDMPLDYFKKIVTEVESKIGAGGKPKSKNE